MMTRMLCTLRVYWTAQLCIKIINIFKILQPVVEIPSNTQQTQTYGKAKL